MKKSLMVLAATMVLAAIVVVSAEPAPQKPTSAREFSADMKMTAPRGPSGSGKIYVSGNKLRMEMNSGGQQMVTIFDGQANAGWMLMPEQRMYMEMRQQSEMAQLAKQAPSDNPCDSIPNATCRRVGEEVVNGRNTVKWEIAMDQGGRKSTITQWFDASLGFVIRQQTSEGMTLDITNVKPGAQPENLFILPSGYQKISVPGMPR